MKNHMSVGTPFSEFERILGALWEAEILDFRTFFVIFSKQNLEGILEGLKIRS